MTLMTEQIQDQLSAFVDDELSSEECAFFVRRLQRDSDATHTVLRFAVIGTALRDELVQPDPGILLRRIDAALDGTDAEPGVARRRVGGGREGLWRPVLGVAISAGVAAVAVLLMRTVNVGGGAETGAGGLPIRASRPVEPATYVVPSEPASNQMITSPIRLTNYLMHHGEYTSRLGRTIVNSNVVVSTGDAMEIELDDTPAAAEIEPTAAEERRR